MINYYVVLEIPNFSDQTVIKKAYRKLSKKYHPDVNKDPFAATYFLKINEAYNFLSDDNKRLLLHQFLNVTNTSQKYKVNEQQNAASNNQILKPVIHFFTANKKFYQVNDHILVQWNVSQCKSVHLNVFGSVPFTDARYLKIDHFLEELTIIMTVIGLDNQQYKYRINLQYENINPTKKAFQKIKVDFPDADEIHFKKETFFGLHARTEKNTFKNRILLLSILLFADLILLFSTSGKIFFFLVALILIWIILGQAYKRMHDTLKYKNDIWKLFVPFYNVFIFKELFALESEPTINQFGVVPKKLNLNFTTWLSNCFKKLNAQLTLLQKISFGTFAALLLLVSFKALTNYKEIPAELTSYYIENSRPTTDGYVQSDYILVFNDNITVNVSRDDFYTIAYKKEFDKYEIALNDNKIEYVTLLNSKTNQSSRVSFGIFQSNNPLLLIVLLIFIAQLYVWRNLTAANELPFANAYMVFALLFYLYGFYLMFFT